MIVTLDQICESLTESVSNAAKDGIKSKYNIKDSEINAVMKFIRSNPDIKADLDKCKTSKDVVKVMASKKFKDATKKASDKSKEDKSKKLDTIEKISKITLFIVLAVWYCKLILLQRFPKFESSNLLTEATKNGDLAKYVAEGVKKVTIGDFTIIIMEEGVNSKEVADTFKKGLIKEYKENIDKSVSEEGGKITELWNKKKKVHYYVEYFENDPDYTTVVFEADKYKVLVQLEYEGTKVKLVQINFGSTNESAILTEAKNSYKKDKYGNWLTGKSFKGVPITVHCYKDKPTEEELISMLADASFDKALAILNKKENVELLYNEVAKAVNEYGKQCLEGRNDENSTYYKMCKKYVDSVDYCKSSLKLDVVRFDEWKNKPIFNFAFDSELPAQDDHSIFVEDCGIDLESKTLSVKRYNISFEG